MTKTNSFLLLAGGILNILGALFHFAFWYLFNWKDTLSTLSTIDRNIMLMLNYCLATFFLLIGIMCIRFRKNITESLLGRFLLLTLGIVYAVRLALEFILPGGTIFMAAFLAVMILCFFIPALIPTGSIRDRGFSFR
ncbi:MAG: hypothetical protein JW801_19015 [Bacteroidales bacterium]|nr:hypothetical protein [Bacteroidales bacterium]